MAALTYDTGNSSADPIPPRNALLRILDTLAEWQMRHSHSVINRGCRVADDIDDTAERNRAN